MEIWPAGVAGSRRSGWTGMGVSVPACPVSRPPRQNSLSETLEGRGCTGRRLRIALWISRSAMRAGNTVVGQPEFGPVEHTVDAEPLQRLCPEECRGIDQPSPNAVADFPCEPIAHRGIVDEFRGKS